MRIVNGKPWVIRKKTKTGWSRRAWATSGSSLAGSEQLRRSSTLQVHFWFCFDREPPRASDVTHCKFKADMIDVFHTNDTSSDEVDTVTLDLQLLSPLQQFTVTFSSSFSCFGSLAIYPNQLWYFGTGLTSPRHSTRQNSTGDNYAVTKRATCSASPVNESQ